MAEIDTLLARLRESPVHPGLDGLDAAVMAELAGRRAGPQLGGGAFILAATLALAIGIVGSAVPGAPARAAPVAPFGTAPMLAPSTLLGTGE
ncbi:hypothetical protein RCO27_14240 [Sphingosinicella sp. LHD-64]|uniref:hypothetical protein n=1 Tax=Sphingosinicella sp. LHD-64 TaxID=3072139 RepID=UPI0028102D52|nr:hypothetical protein [Sphingosinicella sp. LHD-64]MDQ8757386.1 hypothetical protein [Sphingosinicella sp. LHD-64]